MLSSQNSRLPRTQLCRRCKTTYIWNVTSEEYHKSGKCKKFAGYYVEKK